MCWLPPSHWPAVSHTPSFANTHGQRNRHQSVTHWCSSGWEGKSSHQVKWLKAYTVSKQERGDDKWHSSRSRKLRNKLRNRFAIVRHEGKSVPMVIAFILMLPKGLRVYICKEITSFIIHCEDVPCTREPQRCFFFQNGN